MIDPRIAMGAQAPNLQSSLNLFQNTLNQMQGRRMNEQNMAQSAELQPFRVQAQEQALQSGQQVIDQNNMKMDEARRLQYLKSVTAFDPVLRPFLESGDQLGALNALQQRRQQLIRDELPTETTDDAIQQLMNGNVDTVLGGLDLAKREYAQAIGNNQNIPTELVTRQRLLEDLNSENPDVARSARIKLNLEAKPSSAAEIEIANSLGLTNKVAASQATIAGEVASVTQEIKTRGEGKSAAIKAAVGEASKVFPKIANYQDTIKNYDNAIAELDAGANTGTIYSIVPSLNAANKRLDNIIKNLGLNVVGNTTFGALSESELDFALRAAIPDNLEPQDLKRWLVAKKTAQQKILTGLEEFVKFTGSGEKTLSDWQNREALLKFSPVGGSNQPQAQQNTNLNIENIDINSLTEEQIDQLLMQAQPQQGN